MRGREHRIGAAFRDGVDEVVQGPGAARGDHRHRHRVGHRAGQRQVVAVLGAVAVHAGEQDLAGAAVRPLARPRDGVEAGGLAPAVGVDVPAWPSPSTSSRRRLASMATTMHWLPKLRAPSVDQCGLATAAVLS